MNDGINRREFLKYSVAAGVLIASGHALKGAGLAEEPGSLTPVDRLTVWVLADNYYDALRPDSAITKRFRSVPGRSFHAEHGLAYYVETVVDGKASTCMFDFASDTEGLLNNIRLLGINIGKTNAFGLSHGHWDHYLTASQILKRHQSELAAGTPFYVGEEAFNRRYSRRPNTTEPADLGRLSQEDIESAGLKIVEVKDPTPIIPGAYLSGNIKRITSYEKVPPSLLIQRGDTPEPDDFRGEQALIFNVKGKGLVVISGCAHAGIVNTVKHAQNVAGTEQLHAVMGGFHLINAKPEIIQDTVADIKAMKPDYIAPAHCTGFEAIVAIRSEMPEAFTMNTAGTRYTFGA